MPITAIAWLDAWVLHWLHEEAQQSKALLAVSAQKLLSGFARQERQQIRASLDRLETRGLIVVGRVVGKKPVYLSLSAAGAQWVLHGLGRLDV